MSISMLLWLLVVAVLVMFLGECGGIGDSGIVCSKRVCANVVELVIGWVCVVSMLCV